MKIDDLVRIASAPLIDTVARLDDPTPLGGGRLEPQVRALLRRCHGFYAFESALHIFPAGVKKDVMDVETWNASD